MNIERSIHLPKPVVAGMTVLALAMGHEATHSLSSDAYAQNSATERQYESSYDIPNLTLVKCAGRVATIAGTNKSEVIYGTKKSDVIVGLGGNDQIHGRAGNDIICGGNGNDTVFSGKGNDRVASGNGNDLIKGSEGNDTLEGNKGADMIMGETGKDKLFGGEGDDELLGTSSSDRLSGSTGQDWCRGSARAVSCESQRGLTGVSGISPRRGRGGLTIKYQVLVERGIAINREAVADKVDAVLADKRSWIKSGRYSFKRVNSGANTQVILATPSKVDQLCYPLATRGRVSCRQGNRIILNLDRWRYAVSHWRGSVDSYRSMLINHEMGHRIGKGHSFCSGFGRKAPVMQQQTKFLLGCKENPWPLPGE